MEKGKNCSQEQFFPLSTIFYYLMLHFYVKTGIRFSLRDKQLFEITEVEITRVDCIENSKTRGQTVVDLGEVAIVEPPHLDLHCLLFQLFSSLVLKRVNPFLIGNL